MSSLFLNSPSTRITSPFSSTSVHLSLGSRAALAACVRLGLNMEPFLPGSPPPGRSSAFNLAALFAALDASLEAAVPHILSCHEGLHKTLGVWSSEAYRGPPASPDGSFVVIFTRCCCLRHLGTIAFMSSRPACIHASRWGLETDSRRVGCLSLLLLVLRKEQAPLLESKKARPSDCARRNRSKDREGAGRLNAGGGMAATWGPVGTPAWVSMSMSRPEKEKFLEMS